MGDRSSDSALLVAMSEWRLGIGLSNRGSRPGLHHVGVEVPSEASLETSKAALPAKGLTLDSEVEIIRLASL